MNTSVNKVIANRGINPTTYDPRVKEKQQLDVPRVKEMEIKLQSIDPLIDFSHVIPNKLELLNSIDTKWGAFLIGSPLSFHLSAVDFNYKVITSLELEDLAQTDIYDHPDVCKVNLPQKFPELPEPV